MSNSKFRLQGQAALRELLKDEQDIKDSKLPDAEKELELLKIGVDVRMQALETQQQLDLLAKNELEAKESALKPLKDEMELLEAKLVGKEEEYLLTKQIKELEAAGVPKAEASSIVNRVNELKKQNEALEETKSKINEMSQAIASGFTNAIRSVINGTKSVDEAFSDMLSSIGQSFVDMALKVIEQQLVMIANGLLMKALGVSMPGASSVPGTGYGDMSVAGPSFFQGGMIPGYADGGPVKSKSTHHRWRRGRGSVYPWHVWDDRPQRRLRSHQRSSGRQRRSHPSRRSRRNQCCIGF